MPRNLDFSLKKDGSKNKWLPDLGWAVGWEVVLITEDGINVGGGEGGRTEMINSYCMCHI